MADEQDAPRDGDDMPGQIPGNTPLDDGEGDDIASAALRAAQEAVSALSSQAAAATNNGPSPFSAPPIAPMDISAMPKGLDLLSDVNVHVTIELGRTRMLVEDVLRLSEGSVVELDKLAGDPVDVFVNERLVARGEVLVLNDNFCVRVNEILDADTVEQD